MNKLILIQVVILPTMLLAACTKGHRLDCNVFRHNQARFVQSIDANRDGRVSHEEWGRFEYVLRERQAAATRKYGAVPNSEDISSIFNELDRDSNGYLTPTEISHGVCPVK